MSIFFDEDTATKISNTASYATGNITGFKENAAAAYKAFVSSELSTSELMNTQEEYGNLTQILHDNGHTTFFFSRRRWWRAVLERGIYGGNWW